MGVNAFDQPQVQDSKDRTRAAIDEIQSTRQPLQTQSDLSIEARSNSKDVAARLLGFLGKAGAADYVAIQAYLPRRQAILDELQRLRVAIRERTGSAVTVGFGPRFLHSTGQFHKGGPNSGLFIQIVSEASHDLDIPGQNISFGTLIRAQAVGDFEALVARGRRVFRVHLSRPEDVAILWRAFQ